ncbi:CaiB/BaiF CoA transferase family protein [Allopusillimonas ginsengisoli]|uniref:CaiB/BaiF CoA transferase family protein n=1 Tax=Allopusillimonas ginsengisoli TaxID=453575 RepID=UPI00101EF3CA|nr:CoA transferase [Allopusillimonas ginsengisoli]TEA76942.1 CoA transferase [Allopusillimonas ginsengisoli]
MNEPLATTGALHGCKVVDLSRVLGGPYCTQILADHGADVFKIEPPSGDETRGWGPPFQEGTASYFLGVNRNKYGLSLDLSAPEGQAFLKALLQDADVLVENFKPGTLEKWGLSPASLQKAFPRLVHCRITGFGADGPLGGLPGYDACAQAMCGLMSVNGDADGEPTRVGLPVVDMVTGLNAALAILMAINERHRSDRGQFLDITLFDCAISLLHPHAANYFLSGKIPQRTGNAHPNISPYESFATGEGEIFLAVGNNRQFALLAEVLGQPDLSSDARFLSNADRIAHRDALRQTLAPLLSRHQATDLAQVLLKKGVPAAPVLNVEQLLQHPHTRHRGMVLEEGDFRAIASPIKLSRTPATLRRLPPAFGEHNEAVKATLSVD